MAPIPGISGGMVGIAGAIAGGLSITPAAPTYHGNVNSFNVSLGVLPVAGNLILIAISSRETTASSSVSGFTQLGAFTNASSPVAQIASNFRLFGKIATGSEGTSIAATDTGVEVASQGVVISGNRNGLSSSEVFVQPESGTATASPDPGAMSPGWGTAGILWMHFINHESATSFTPSTGYTTMGNSYNVGRNEQDMAGQYKIAISSTENPGAFTSTGGGDYQFFGVAVRPA